MVTKNIENSTQMIETTENDEMPSLLVGYVRRSNAGGAIKSTSTQMHSVIAGPTRHQMVKPTYHWSST